MEFDFVLEDVFHRLVSPVGLADYCVAQIGGERIEAAPDEKGHFAFSHRFEAVQPDEKIKVRATAYQQRGERDFMMVRGQWLQADSPYAQPDRKIAGDSLKLAIYRAMVDLRMPRPPDDLDLETGVMRFRRLDGTVAPVYIDRPGRPGFVVTGPEPDGYYRITYAPKAEELNPTGTTEVVFTIHDAAGQPHTVSTELDTP